MTSIVWSPFSLEKAKRESKEQKDLEDKEQEEQENETITEGIQEENKDSLKQTSNGRVKFSFVH